MFQIAVRTNPVFYLVPIVEKVGDWIVLAEPVDTATVLGFLVIIVGFTVLVTNSTDFPIGSLETPKKTAANDSRVLTE